MRNTSVSIRVESSGTTGPVSQANDATASADGVAVAVSNDAVNTVVAVVVGATDLDRPGPAGLQVWVWEWVWERDESESLEGAVGADVTSWVWDWGKEGPKHGTVTSRAAGDDDGGRTAGRGSGAGTGIVRASPDGRGVGTGTSRSDANRASGSGTGRGAGADDRAKSPGNRRLYRLEVPQPASSTRLAPRPTPKPRFRSTRA